MKETLNRKTLESLVKECIEECKPQELVNAWAAKLAHHPFNDADQMPLQLLPQFLKHLACLMANPPHPIRIQVLKRCVQTSKEPGNWNYSPYMRGMTNGLILAASILDNEEPLYLNSPGVYLETINKDLIVMTETERVGLKTAAEKTPLPPHLFES